MNIVVLFNPRSGGASRRAEVERLAVDLRVDGHETAVAHAGPAPGSDATATVAEAARHADLLVVAGGDGTLHHALAEASRTRAAVYHWPLGTENLFARRFGMTRRRTDLARALAVNRVEEVDLGECDGRLFALMCSVGPDAAVIHRLAAARTGSIRRWTYLGPIWRELHARAPSLRVWVDGEMLVDGRRGMVVVANAPNYGFSFNPAPMAVMNDGLLDVVFLPAGTSWGVLGWLCLARVGRHARDARMLYRAGREIVVANAGDAPAPAQCDGEATATLACGTGPGCAHEIVVRQRALRVLVPAP